MSPGTLLRRDHIDQIPSGLADALAERRASVTSIRVNRRKRIYLHASGPTGDLFGRFSHDPSYRKVLAREVEMRDRIGVAPPLRTPPVLARGENWVLEPAISSTTCRGATAVDNVVAAAAEIMKLDVAQGRKAQKPPTARVRQRANVLWRGLRSPTRSWLLREYNSANALLLELLRNSSLPRLASHGDFNPGNVLIEGDMPWVIDWESLARRPAGYDLMQFWFAPQRPEDRQRLLERTVGLVGSEHRQDILRLRYIFLVRSVTARLVPRRGRQKRSRDIAEGRALRELLPAVRAEAGITKG